MPGWQIFTRDGLRLTPQLLKAIGPGQPPAVSFIAHYAEDWDKTLGIGIPHHLTINSPQYQWQPLPALENTKEPVAAIAGLIDAVNSYIDEEERLSVSGFNANSRPTSSVSANHGGLAIQEYQRG